jgi:hypothetical protein
MSVNLFSEVCVVLLWVDETVYGLVEAPAAIEVVKGGYISFL